MAEDDKLNKVKCNEILRIHELPESGEFHENEKQYRLKSVVSQNTKTGEIYAESKYESGNTMDSFKEYSPEILRQVAIYELDE